MSILYDHVIIDLGGGREAMLVRSHDIIPIADVHSAQHLLAHSRGGPSWQLRELAQESGLVDVYADDDDVNDAIAELLASGEYSAVVVQRPHAETSGQGLVGPDGEWSQATRLADLAEPTSRPSLHELAFELVDHRGTPYAGLELTLYDATGGRHRIVLDERGYWGGRSLPGPGSARLELPPDLGFQSPGPGTFARDGFVVLPGDVSVARAPEAPLVLTLDRVHRLVVEAPADAPVALHYAVTEVVIDGYAQGATVMRWGGMRARTDGTVATARAALRLALWNGRGKQVAVAGHADPLGQDSDNDALSLERAKSVQLFASGQLDAWAQHAVACASELDLACALVACHRILGLGPAGIDDAPKLDAALAAVRRGAKHSIDGPVGVEDWVAFAELYEVDLAALMMTDRAGLAEIRGSVSWIDPPIVALGESQPVELIDRVDVVGPVALAQRRCSLLVFGTADEGPAAVGAGGHAVYDGTYRRTILRVPGEVLAEIEVSTVRRDPIARGRAWISCGEMGATEHIAGADGYVRFTTLAGDAIEVVAAFDANGRGTMVAAGTEAG